LRRWQGVPATVCEDDDNLKVALFTSQCPVQALLKSTQFNLVDLELAREFRYDRE